MAVIREVDIIFTEDRTTIGRARSDIPNSLKITILPNASGTTIESIDVAYAGQHYGKIVHTEIFNGLTLSVNSNGNTLLERVSNYLNQLPNEEFNIIVQQYSLYIEDGIIIDGIICGIAAYLTFLLLNEDRITLLCPYTLLVPTDIYSGNSINKQMFRTLMIPLTALKRTTNRVLTQLVSFVTTFINMWEPLFIDGPKIPESNDIHVAIDILTQMTQASYHDVLTVNQQIAKIKTELMTQLTAQLTAQLTEQVLTSVKQHLVNTNQINDLIATNINTSAINNISNYYPDTSEIIYEKSQSQLSDKSDKLHKFQENHSTNIVSRRNNDHATRATKIQSTGRIQTPLPWRK